jgi:predicted RNase H-like nuclease
MPIVLGLDAAWTADGSNGVALVDTDHEPPRAIAYTSGYASFTQLPHGDVFDRSASRQGGEPPLRELLAAAGELAGKPVDVIVVDMPLSWRPITGRRSADDAISARFGGRGCSTHSPSAERPGPISDKLRETAGQLGYPLTTTPGQRSAKALIETYPHPAVLHLTNATFRVPYKVGKRRAYRPDLTPPERIAAVARNLSFVSDHLRTQLEGIELEIAMTARPVDLKKIEDIIDALICCWVGVRWLDGAAEPFGDDQAAIWVPRPLASAEA